ncbi:MAG: hypothetical protein AB1810_00210 [Pseudomonadota bacterium]
MTAKNDNGISSIMMALFLLCICLTMASCAADHTQRPVVDGPDQALHASPERLALGYMAVSLNLLASRAVEKQPNITLQTIIDGRPVTINQSNATQFIAAQEIQLKTYSEAINRRGFRNVGGMYHAEATPSCERIQSAWASGVRWGFLTGLSIVQDGFEVQIVQRVEREDISRDVKTPGVVVESKLVFSDFTNSSFIFVGMIEPGKITVRPNVEAVLATWPKMTKAPSKSDLSGCVVTLLPVHRN